MTHKYNLDTGYPHSDDASRLHNRQTDNAAYLGAEKVWTMTVLLFRSWTLNFMYYISEIYDFILSGREIVCQICLKQ